MTYSEHLMGSTGWLADYSGGPSPRTFTMPWNPSIFDATVATYAADFLYACQDPTEDEPWLRIGVEARGDEVALSRFVGCFVIGMMPDKGMPEVLRLLREMWDFYTEESPSVEVPQLPPKRTEARIVEHSIRPDMVIAP